MPDAGPAVTPKRMEHRRPDRLTLGAFGAAALLGGTSTVAVHFSNVELPPFWGAAVRLGSASILLFVGAAALRLTLPRGRALAGAALFGLLAFTVTYAQFYWAVLHLPAGFAQTIMAVVPLMTVFLAVAHGVERFRGRAVAGALLAAGGILLVFGQRPGGAVSLVALLALLGAAASTAESGVLIKWFPPSHPVVFNAVAMAVGSTGLLALSAAAGERPVLPAQPATQVALGYLVLFGSVGFFLLYVFVYQRWTASAAAYQFLLFPFGTVALDAWLVGETITPMFLIGGALVLVGVYVGAFSETRKVLG